MRKVVLTALTVLAFGAFTCGGCKKPAPGTTKPTTKEPAPPPMKAAPGEKSTTPETQKQAAAPETQKEATAPEAKKEAAAPETKKESAASPTPTAEEKPVQ